MTPLHNAGLLVSCDPAVLRPMTVLLSEVFIDTTICSQEQRVFELAAQADFYIVVLDLGAIQHCQPLIQRLRRDKQPIVITVAEQSSDKQELLQIAADLVLLKPLSLTTGRRLIKQLLTPWNKLQASSRIGPRAPRKGAFPGRCEGIVNGP